MPAYADATSNSKINDLTQFNTKLRVLLLKTLSPNNEANTPTCKAIMRNDLKHLKYLATEKKLSSDSCVIESNGDSAFYTPLYLAYKLKQQEIFQFLLNSSAFYGADFSMFLAAEAGEFDYLLSLIQKGADLHIVNRKDETLLDLALNSNNKSLVSFLREHNVTSRYANNDDLIDLYISLKMQDIDLFDQSSKDINKKDVQQIFYKAIYDSLSLESHPNDLKTLQFMIEEPQVYNFMPMTFKQIFKAALKEGSDKSDLILYLLQSPRLHVPQSLAVSQVMKRIYSSPPLIDIRLKGWENVGRDELVLSLIQNQLLNPNSPPGDVEYPLILALQFQEFELAQQLINMGAKLNVQSKFDYKTPAIIYIAESNQLKLAKQFIEAGGDVNQQDNFGDTALIYASGNGHKDMVQFLLTHGALLKHQTHDGDTALLAAAENGHIEAFEYLLLKGANMKHKNKFGEGVLTLAKKYTRDKLLRHLEYKYQIK